ncbi:MAG: carboxy terminal-processing peptidase [Verrucomicrobiae bacterium]|nr:carboxy terminal-processing peptidase [Verrucomicrobiae bacterium]
MSRRFSRAVALLLAALLLPTGTPLRATTASAAPQPTDDDSRIALVVARFLSREHFRRHAIDDEISRSFLSLYLNTLDYSHLMFLESDLQEFQKYATTLDDETLRGNVRPGFEIFARYLQRVEQRVALVKEILKEKLAFGTNERFLKDRTEAPWPKDEEEARKLWRQRVKLEVLQELLAKRKPAEAVQIVGKRYDRLLRAVREEDAESVLQTYLTSLARAFDPHSDYMPPQELDTFAINMKLSLQGIGAVLGTEDGYAKILAIVPGGPADLDHRLQVNDRIAAVAQGNGPLEDVVDMKLAKVVEKIRGEKGTEVRLLVIPAKSEDLSARAEIRLVRDEIKLTEAETKARLVEKNGPDGRTHRYGYLDIPSFYTDFQMSGKGKSVTQDTRRLIERLQEKGAEGLVLDLRKNGGGALAEVVELAGLFLRKGPVVQVESASGGVRVLDDDDPSVVCDLPLVVLVSHISASAAEILAAVLQDYGRAVIVGGTSTFGKGTVQKIEDLSRYVTRGGALKLTVQKFYRVSGGSTQYRGVVPDLQWPSPMDVMKIGEAALKHPLPYDEIAPTVYRPVNHVAAVLPELKRRFQARLTTDPEFIYIRHDIERLKAQIAEKTVSLNLVERQKERSENLARMERREKERKARPAAPWKVTELTLEELSGGAPKTAALTKKVLDQASATLREDEILDATDGEARADGTESTSKSDPEYEEGLHILADYVELGGGK